MCMQQKNIYIKRKKKTGSIQKNQDFQFKKIYIMKVIRFCTAMSGTYLGIFVCGGNLNSAHLCRGSRTQTGFLIGRFVFTPTPKKVSKTYTETNHTDAFFKNCHDLLLHKHLVQFYWRGQPGNGPPVPLPAMYNPECYDLKTGCLIFYARSINT